MSARDAWREVCMAEYRITGNMLKATEFADSVEQRIRTETLLEAAEEFDRDGFQGRIAADKLRNMANER